MTDTIYLVHYDDYNPVADVMTTDDPDYAYVCIHVLHWHEITAQAYSVLSALKKAQLRQWDQESAEYDARYGATKHDWAIKEVAVASLWYGIKE